MLRAAVLLSFLRRILRFSTTGRPGALGASYVASWQLPRLDSHQLADDSLSGHTSEALVAKGVSGGPLVAYATFAIFVAGAIGCWAGGLLADRWGRPRTTMLMMALSGSCAVLIGLLFGSSPWLVLLVGLVWGFAVVADSAQFSTMVTELADQSYVGTALTLQLATGFTITVATIWLIPLVQEVFGWRWAFAFLAPGPFLGVLAMLWLRSLPEADCIGGGTRTATSDAYACSGA